MADQSNERGRQICPIAPLRDPCSFCIVGLCGEPVSLDFVIDVWLRVTVTVEGEERAKRFCGKCVQSQEGHDHFYPYSLTPASLQGRLRDVAACMSTRKIELSLPVYFFPLPSQKILEGYDRRLGVSHLVPIPFQPSP